MKLKKNGNYTAVGNEILRNENVSLKARGLFVTMWSLPEDWDFSENGLVEILKESRTSVRSTLKELENHGYLIREQLRSENGFGKAQYVLSENRVITKRDNTKRDTIKTNTNKTNTNKTNTNVVKGELPTKSQIDLAIAKGIDYNNNNKYELAQKIQEHIKQEKNAGEYIEPTFDIPEATQVLPNEDMEELLK